MLCMYCVCGALMRSFCEVGCGDSRNAAFPAWDATLHMHFTPMVEWLTYIGGSLSVPPL
jgi:hypothetical protein